MLLVAPILFVVKFTSPAGFFCEFLSSVTLEAVELVSNLASLVEVSRDFKCSSFDWFGRSSELLGGFCIGILTGMFTGLFIVSGGEPRFGSSLANGVDLEISSSRLGVFGATELPILNGGVRSGIGLPF